MNPLYCSRLIIPFAVLLGFSESLQAQTTTFSYTGAVQTYTVPTGVSTLGIDASGGCGGGAYVSYGSEGPVSLGGRVQCNLAVTPGSVLYIYVGGGVTSFDWGHNVTGGFNAGGTNGTFAGAGGGATDIRLSAGTVSGNQVTPYTASNRVVIAGGGGGGGDFSAPGGLGGGLTGGDGGLNIYGFSGTAGSGGTQTGTGPSGIAGGLGYGGNGSSYSGGGGGGGLYGGNGGNGYNGGGGGSSYTDPVLCTAVTHTQGYSGANGNGQVSITPLCTAPTVFAVTGGGTYCLGGAAVYVGLSNSQTSVSYQLYKSGTAYGSPVPGTGSAISFGFFTAPGIYTVVANPTGSSCPSSMSGSATVTSSAGALPAIIPVGGGGTYCAGGVGVPVSLPGSSVGFNYQLYLGGIAVGSPLAGIGSALSFGPQTAPGIYTIIATSTINGCENNMIGSTNVAVYPTPVIYTMTGGGSYCPGRSGVAIGLSGSAAGIGYQLYRGGVAVSGALMPGTGTAISFPAQTIAGTYTAVATNTTTFCTSNMSGSATVTNSAPAVYTVTGGGSICSGGSGASIGLSNSATGVNYQLYRGTTLVGSAVVGTGTAISFGSQTVAGAYTVVATDVSSGCTASMSGSAVITILSALPTFTVTGGGSYCSGGSGVAVGLSSSVGGTSYQLYNGSATVGSPVSGTGGPLSFGLQTASGTYTVVATNTTSGCTRTMTGSVTITVNPTPVISGSVYTVMTGSSITLLASPAGGTWTSSNTAVATVNATTGIVSGIAAGTTNITYVLSSGCKVSHNVVVTMSTHRAGTESTTGIKLAEENRDIKAIPNPNKGLFLIEGTLPSSEDQEVSIVVTDLIGQVVYTRKAIVSKGTINETIQLPANLASGMYLLTLHTTSETKVLRLVVQQ